MSWQAAENAATGASRRQFLTRSVNMLPDKRSMAARPGCPHPADTQDEIGAGFGVATVAGKFDRGCVCVTGESTR
jgi:hypothetical protein